MQRKCAGIARYWQQSPGKITTGSVSMALVVAMLTVGANPSHAEEMSFAGISRHTSMAELTRRYPHSQVTGTYLYVAAVDSHEQIFGIGLPSIASPGRLLLSFEQPPDAASGKPAEYPDCPTIAQSLEERYGPPWKERVYVEEELLNYQHWWRQGPEVLSLLCFSKHGGAWLAKSLNIEAASP